MTALLPLDSVLPICISERPEVPAEELPLIPMDEQPVIAIIKTVARIVFMLYSFVDLIDDGILLRSDVFSIQHGALRCRKSIRGLSAVRQRTTSNGYSMVFSCTVSDKPQVLLEISIANTGPFPKYLTPKKCLGIKK